MAGDADFGESANGGTARKNVFLVLKGLKYDSEVADNYFNDENVLGLIDGDKLELTKNCFDTQILGKSDGSEWGIIEINDYDFYNSGGSSFAECLKYSFDNEKKSFWELEELIDEIRGYYFENANITTELIDGYLAKLKTYVGNDADNVKHLLYNLNFGTGLSFNYQYYKEKIDA